MKSPLLLLAFVSTMFQASAQPYFDSLQRQLRVEKNDTARVQLLCDLAQYHEYIQSDSNPYYVNKAIELSGKIGYPTGKFLALRSVFFAENLRANYPKALQIALSNVAVAKELMKDSLYFSSFAHQDIALVSREMGDSVKNAEENAVAFRLFEASGRIDGDCWPIYARISSSFLGSHPDSAIFYALKAHELAIHSLKRRTYMGLSTAGLANTYQVLGNYSSARHFYQIALQQCVQFNNVYIQARVYRDLARLFNKMGQKDSCVYFAQRALAFCEKYGFGDYGSNVGELLSKLYESQHQPDSALKYMKVMFLARDSIFGMAKFRQYQASLFDAEKNQLDVVSAAERYREQVKLYFIVGVAFVFLILLMLMYYNNRQKQRAFKLIRRQKQETDEQKLKVEQAYSELKSTQNQLIQSEKMASLGELTAGIAHEIQNPLNFINNFSEVNRELIDDWNNEMENGNTHEAKLIAKDIFENQDKINQHGKRIDAIVKSMLQHSRESTGQKEATDINALANEYLMLAYHGFRAKDKSFNPFLYTDFDPSIGKMDIIPQDIGRVLLNIYNNSFYAIAEKKRLHPESGELSVSVTTKKSNGQIEIKVKDNGMGIPLKALDKIFQPFFTTKPTGQGTGLGLSLSYDIIKAHGGKIKVDTREGEFTEFIIQLPI